MDATDGGRPLKILSVLDEASRYALAVKVSCSLSAEDLMLELELERLMTLHWPPEFIRSDNGPNVRRRRQNLPGGQWSVDLVNTAWLPLAQRLLRERKRSPARRAPEPGALRDLTRSRCLDRGLEELLQPRAAARRDGVRHPANEL